MRLLLDTQALIWWLEIAAKTAIGRLRAPGDLPEQLVANSFTELPLTVRHALAMEELPLIHRDPFDRMLIAQARSEGLTLVTSDRAISGYVVPLLPADR